MRGRAACVLLVVVVGSVAAWRVSIRIGGNRDGVEREVIREYPVVKNEVGEDPVEAAKEGEMVEPEVVVTPEASVDGGSGEGREEDATEAVIRAGRVAGDLPNRAALAAAVVVPELAPGLQGLGVAVGDPIFIRIFKAEREMELWIYHGGQGRYRLFKTYPVAGMSGELGPKLAEGDLQAPEGFYFVGRSRMNPASSYHLSFDLGYPNTYDRAHGRTGSYLMVHGSVVSVGCFAMTDHGIEEIYTLADAALSGGQKYFRVHVFPFRMTARAMAEAGGHEWFAFWENLREGYDHFERQGIPPDVSVSGLRYAFTEERPPG